MKRILAILVLALFSLSANKVLSQMTIGFSGGLSTPNNNINDVWNSSRVRDTANLPLSLYRAGTTYGYNLGIKFRYPVSSSFILNGGVSFVRFPESDIKAQPVGTAAIDSVVRQIKTTQSIIPINVGLSYYVLHSLLGVYVTGDLSYNYILNNVTYKGLPIDASMSPSDNRVGCGLGAGIDLDIKIVTLNLEAKYSIANLIGKTGDELSKSYLNVNLAVFFGSSSTKSSDSEK